MAFLVHILVTRYSNHQSWIHLLALYCHWGVFLQHLVVSAACIECMWIYLYSRLRRAISWGFLSITHSLWNFFRLIFSVVFCFASFLTHLYLPSNMYLFLDLWRTWFESIIYIWSQHNLYITPLNACFSVDPYSPQIPATPHKTDLISQGPRVRLTFHLASIVIAGEPYL